MKLAMRIKSRAVDRCGEIIRSTPPATNRYDVSSGADGDPAKGQLQIARDAGMSRRQAKTAVRVNSVPRDQFEAMVEGDSPPTITKLAEIGTKHDEHLRGRDPVDFEQAT